LQDRSTDFEFLPIDVSLGRCQRYFELIYLDEFVSCGQAQSTSSVKADLHYLTEKRANPTITLPTTGITSGTVNFLKSDTNYPNTTGTITVSDITVSRFNLGGTGFTSSFTAGNACYFYSSSTSQIKIDSEL
jgi:hypothetical protein